MTQTSSFPNSSQRPVPVWMKQAALEALGTARQQAISRQSSKLIMPYRRDPVAFVHDILGVTEIRPYQEHALSALLEHRRVCMRGPHGIGKTALEAWAVLWALAVHEEIKAPTTASAWRQLTEYLWPEIHKWSSRAKWDRIGLRVRPERELLKRRLQLGDNRFAFALASSDEAKIEGAHSAVVFYGFDEAKTIQAEIWDAAEGAFSTGEGYALAISTPGEPAGRFYDIQTNRRSYPHWHIIRVTESEARRVVPGFAQWADLMAVQWGEQSAVYQNRVAGEFAQSETDTVIPLAWVEAAMDRWTPDGRPSDTPTTFGADIARTGENKTVFAPRTGNWFAPLIRHSKRDTMETAGFLASEMISVDWANVDVIGIGAGVFDRLREQGLNVRPINVGEATGLRDKTGRFGFVNLRSALLWGLRERLEPESGDDIALPPDDDLLADLTAPKWTLTSAGKIKVESKDEIVKRLGRSPDSGDAVMLAYAAPESMPGAVREANPKARSKFVRSDLQGGRFGRDRPAGHHRR